LNIIIIRYGEIILKGFNRKFFEEKLINNIKQVLKDHQYRFRRADSLIYLEIDNADLEAVARKLSKIFGVVSINIAAVTNNELESICQTALIKLEEQLLTENHSFKVVSKRGNKKFPLSSLEISREVGAFLLTKHPNLRVDVHNPEITIFVEVREEQTYVYSKKIPGPGGLPYGTSGRGLLLLSGGIDSPVAGWLMAKRGLELEALHFHSYPFTSERAKEKVFDLAQILTQYCNQIKLHTVNLLKIQTEIKKNCPEEMFTIISRRFMMQIAQQIALKNNCEAIITGENLAQVASQTIQGLTVTNSVVDLIVLRPLIGLDKQEIITIAEKINTYKTSILPYEDCCTVFLPKHPVTKPRLEKVIKAESSLDIPALVEEALANLETIEFKQ